jgi:PPIC-type PPIASE domain
MIPCLKELEWPNSSVYKSKWPFALSLGPRVLMRRALLNAALALCAVPALAQAPVPGGPAPNPPATSPNLQAHQRRTPAPSQLPSLAEVPATAPVVTVNAFCKTADKTENKDCKTVLLRSEMDRIVVLLAPSAPLASPQQIAVSYVRVLAAAELANERNLENDPAVAKDLAGLEGFARQVVLAKAFYKQVEQQAANPTVAEMQQYYAAHQQQFEEGEVWRLSVPKSSVSRDGGRIDPAELKAVMDGLHRQAVLGYDFDQIQLQAYKDLNIAQIPPTTRLTAASRSSMPPDQAQVFDLQPGEISEVIDSYTSVVILKLVSKRSTPFDSVEPEIRTELKHAVMQKELQEASTRVTAEFNLKYIGMPSQPSLFPPSGSLPLFSPSPVPTVRRKRPSAHPQTPTAPAPPPSQPQPNS